MMRVFLILFPYWAVGYFLAHIFSIKIGNPCPCPKCWAGSFLSLLYGCGYYFVLGFKGGFGILEYFLSILIAAMIAAALALILCPIRLNK
jgi:hypothetical protein